MNEGKTDHPGAFRLRQHRPDAQPGPTAHQQRFPLPVRIRADRHGKGPKNQESAFGMVMADGAELFALDE